MTSGAVISEVLSRAAKRLAECGVETPQRDARLLFQHVAGWTAAELIAAERDIAPAERVAEFETAVSRRASGEPVSRIRGEKEFWGRMFTVTPDVLDPRPDTEILVETALRLWDETGGDVLDLGVGSGAILLTLLCERPDRRGAGADASKAALVVAHRNARLLGVSARAELVQSDWFAALPTEQRFGLIVSNPPYIPKADVEGLDREVKDHDPEMALVGGADGLDAYRAILSEAAGRLSASGALAFEVGAGQADTVAELMKDSGFDEVAVCKDLSGIDRCVYGRQHPNSCPN